MAGVGRRGFAAAARAAMFANTASQMAGVGWGVPGDGIGMGGRRDNAPRYLDINTSSSPCELLSNYFLAPILFLRSHGLFSPLFFLSTVLFKCCANSLSPLAGTTPPLSPNSNSPSPRSPNSPSVLSSRSSTLTARPNGYGNNGVYGNVNGTSRTPSPASTITADPGKVPFFEKFKDHLPAVDTTPTPYTPGDTSPLSPSSGSDYEGGGLAYADSTDEEDGPLPSPHPPQEEPMLAYADSTDEEDGGMSEPMLAPPVPIPNKSPVKSKNQVRFPSVDEKQIKSALKKSTSSSSGSSGSGSAVMFASLVGEGRERSNSSASGTASNYSHSTTKSTHALDRAMETLFEDTPYTGGPTSMGLKGKSGRSNTIPGLEPLSPEHKPPKLPTRSLTGPSHVSFADAKVKKRKECVRCERVIEDGRWIQTDTGGVLCERCWKNMYLPKVRYYFTFYCYKTLSIRVASVAVVTCP